MREWNISYQITGDEYYPDEITWSVYIVADSIEDAFNQLLEIEKHRVTKIIRIKEV